MALRGRVPWIPPAGQRRVQVDDVRHHRGAEDAGRQQQALRAGEARHEACGQRSDLDRHPQQRDHEPDDDHGEEPRDRALERPVPALLQRQEPEGDDARHQAADRQRQPEQQVERHGAADHLGEVGGDRDALRLHPQPDVDLPGEGVAADLGQVAAGRYLTLAGIASGIFFTIIEYLIIYPATRIKNIQNLTAEVNIISYDFGRSITVTVIAAIIAGLSIGTFEIFYFQNRFRKKSFSYTVVIKSLVYSFTMISCIIIGLFLD